MLEMTALPANYGDCLWIEYGDSHAPHVILIDCGLSVSKSLKQKLEALATRSGRLELVVVTHIDRDHIAGMIGLLEQDFFGVPVRDLWFNGLRHLPGEAFSEKQGERLTELILDKGLPWNQDFEGGRISVDSVGAAVEIPGGASIHLLSPDDGLLKRLRKKWIDVCDAAGLYADPLAEHIVESEREGFGGGNAMDVDTLADAPFIEDVAEANGSSIAFVFKYGTHRILFGADAYPTRLLESLSAAGEQAPYEFDLVKLPHHGSKANVSIPFIKALKCPRYLFSSNGKIYGHPSPEAVARTVRHGKTQELIFNYETSLTSPWNDALLSAKHCYSTIYGTEGTVTVRLL